MHSATPLGWLLSFASWEWRLRHFPLCAQPTCKKQALLYSKAKPRAPKICRILGRVRSGVSSILPKDGLEGSLRSSPTPRFKGDRTGATCLRMTSWKAHAFRACRLSTSSFFYNRVSVVTFVGANAPRKCRVVKLT